MSAQATIQQAGAERATRGGFRFRRRHLWWIPGLAIAVLGSQLSERNGLGILPLIIFQMSPHLPTFGGRRAVPLFNVAHHPLPPLVLLAVAVAASLPPIWLVAGLGWLSHVVIGWGIGDGMRAAGGGHA
jgi:hypothetical protein